MPSVSNFNDCLEPSGWASRCLIEIVPVKDALQPKDAISPKDAPSSKGAAPSSQRKRSFKVECRIDSGANERKIDAWAVYFNEYADFERELEHLEQANSAQVGPRVLRVGKGHCSLDKRQDEEQGQYFILEEHVGSSLKDMLKEGKAAPCMLGSGQEAVLREIGSEERRSQAFKLLFDVASALKSLHDRGLYYLDLKPSNVCVQAYGMGVADIRASLVDFESLRTKSSRPPSFRTMPYYSALFDSYARQKCLRRQSATYPMVDLGFLCLMAASLMTGKLVDSLGVEDIDAAIELPGLRDCFRVLEKRFVASPLNDKVLDALAEQAGLVKVGDGSSEEDRKAAELANRGGYIDAIDLMRLEGNASYILDKRARKIALECHKKYNEVRLADASRTDALEDFMSQKSIKIKQGYRQARDFQGYVEELGYSLVPEGTLSEGMQIIHQLSEDEIEQVAAAEHANWKRLHEEEGWAYGYPTDETSHPPRNRFLRDWRYLSEQDRQYDLVTARNMVGYLRLAGLLVVEEGFDPL